MDAGVKTKKPGGQLERARKGEAVAQASIKSVGIVGAGQMGNGIAHVVSLAGYSVLMSDLKKEAIDNALSVIQKNMARLTCIKMLTKMARPMKAKSSIMFPILTGLSTLRSRRSGGSVIE